MASPGPAASSSTSASSSLDVVFLQDATRSQGPHTQVARQAIQDICQRIIAPTALRQSAIRFCLIAFRDHPPQDRSYVTKDFGFTSDTKVMRKHLDTLVASDGENRPEAQTAAMVDALNLEWAENTIKFVILITDAPPRGLGEDGDVFTKSPDQNNPLALARQMAERGITLFVVACESSLSRYKHAIDFYRALAQTAGGRMIPLVNANQLGDYILDSAIETIETEKLIGEFQQVILEDVYEVQDELAPEKGKELKGDIDEECGYKGVNPTRPGPDFTSACVLRKPSSKKGKSSPKSTSSTPKDGKADNNKKAPIIPQSGSMTSSNTPLASKQNVDSKKVPPGSKNAPKLKSKQVSNKKSRASINKGQVGVKGGVKKLPTTKIANAIQKSVGKKTLAPNPAAKKPAPASANPVQLFEVAQKQPPKGLDVKQKKASIPAAKVKKPANKAKQHTAAKAPNPAAKQPAPASANPVQLFEVAQKQPPKGLGVKQKKASIPAAKVKKPANKAKQHTAAKAPASAKAKAPVSGQMSKH